MHPEGMPAIRDAGYGLRDAGCGMRAGRGEGARDPGAGPGAVIPPLIYAKRREAILGKSARQRNGRRVNGRQT